MNRAYLAAAATVLLLLSPNAHASSIGGGGGGGAGCTLANPTATIGLAAINGAATTCMRSDAAPALSQAIAPTWTGAHTWSPAANTTPLTVSSYSLTGASAQSLLSLSGTLNTTGSPDAFKLAIIHTADG